MQQPVENTNYTTDNDKNGTMTQLIFVAVPYELPQY